MYKRKACNAPLHLMGIDYQLKTSGIADVHLLSLAQALPHLTLPSFPFSTPQQLTFSPQTQIFPISSTDAFFPKPLNAPHPRVSTSSVLTSGSPHLWSAGIRTGLNALQ